MEVGGRRDDEIDAARATMLRRLKLIFGRIAECDLQCRPKSGCRCGRGSSGDSRRTLGMIGACWRKIQEEVLFF